MADGQFAVLLADVGLVFAGCAALGALARRLGQPPVMGEILAGVLLGPTVLGPWSGILFPDDVRPHLRAFGSLGVALFVFVLGAELRIDRLRGRLWNAWAIAAGSLIVSFPVGLGTAAALVASGVQPPGSTVGFALFVAVAISVTAFPVLARILSDRGIAATDVGALAMTVAALTDVFCWSALALSIAVVDGSRTGAWHLALAVPLLVCLRVIVAPLLRRALTARGTGPAVLMAGALLCGAATEAIGLHFIVGSFAFGLLAGRVAGEGRTGLRDDVQARVAQISRLLLPVYFAAAGLAVDIEFSPGSLRLLGLVIGAAMLAKMGGTFVAARVCRIPPLTSATLAALMNARGLTELIVLTTGLELGVIDQRLYSVMVVMALVTTLSTGPLLEAISKRGRVVGQDPFSLDRGGTQRVHLR